MWMLHLYLYVNQNSDDDDDDDELNWKGEQMRNNLIKYIHNSAKSILVLALKTK